MSFECAICMLKVKIADASVLNCGHCFHRECLDKWLNQNLSCPECRSVVDRNGYARFVYPNNSHCDDKCFDVKKCLFSLNGKIKHLEEKYVQLNDEMKYQIRNINYSKHNDIDGKMREFKATSRDFTNQLLSVSDLVHSSASLIDQSIDFTGYYLLEFYSTCKH